MFFLTPNERCIGDLAEEIHYGLMFGRRTAQRVVLLRRYSLRGNPKITNKAIFEIESPYLLNGYRRRVFTTVGNLFLTIFYGHIPASWRYFWHNLSLTIKFIFRRFRGIKEPFPYKHFRYCFNDVKIGVEEIFNRSANFKKGVPFSWSVVQSWDWSSDLENPIDARLSSSTFASCEKKIQQLGIQPQDWFVCLHNREGGFYGDFHDQRNTDIRTYIKGIQFITDRGGWVVRLGDASMTPLPKMDRVIDYPFTNFKSEIMDLYLLKKCRLFVGQNSGVMDVAYLFSKQCVLVNMTEWTIGFPRLRNSLAILKHLYSEEHGRFLSIEELLQQPYSSQDLHSFSRKNKYVDNTDDEIYEVIRESLEQNKEYQYSSLQEKFNRARAKQIESWLTGPPMHTDPEKDRLLRYRVATRMRLQSTLGKKFLEENWSKSRMLKARKGNSLECSY